MPFKGPVVRKIATVAVVNPETKEKMLINKSDFDESVHTLWAQAQTPAQDQISGKSKRDKKRK